MADSSVFAGPALRRIRRREGLTQAATAARLAISPSYLNLMERNQRPVSARVMMRLVEEFDFDPRTLREDATIGGLDGLARRFADKRFADLAIDREEVDEFLSSAPRAAAAFARLYDRAGETSVAAADPVVVSRREVERWRNHFGDLDEAAEELSDELRLSRADLSVALTERLRERHQLAVRLLPRDIMPGAVRRLDLHARQVQLSEMLPPEARVFQLAVQLAHLEQREAIDTIAQGARFDDETARELFLHHLTGYFAAALIMPYGRFLRACDATDYDLPVLQRRFGVSFEQLAHRLTTLQRVGQRGLPFFMVRLDRAGQFSKRIVGASGAEMIEAEHSCPLWAAHKTFERSGELLVQTVNSQGDGQTAAIWLTIGQTVDGAGTGSAAKFAVLLGLDASLAGSLTQARGVSLRAEDAVPIGPGCRRCHIPGCEQRSLPPIGRRLRFDPLMRGTTPFDFGDQTVAR